MLLTSSWLVDTIILFILVIIALHKYISRNYGYWKSKGVHYIKPIPFFGNLYDVMRFKKTMAQWQQDVYNSSDEPYVGVFVFGKPVLTLRSPKLIKEVLVKHFNHFTDRTILAPDHDETISNFMFLSKGTNWKTTRAKMTPAFTSGKLKNMFPITKGIGLEMNQYIKKNQGQLETKELASKYATEVIARTIFGINGHCFDMEDCEFRKIGRLFFDVTWWTAICQSSYFFMPEVANFLHLDFASKVATESLKKILWDTLLQREKTKTKGNDLIDILVELRRDTEFCKRTNFEGDKVVSQPINLFAAGIETTNQAIMFTLYELCLQPALQNELREEILTCLKEKDGVTYYNLNDMKLLEMCILETVRKYPAVPFLDRNCTLDFTIPGTDIVIEKGTSVYIPLHGLHYDEQFFPDPEKYNPYRFADMSTYNQNGLYYLPFGEGPRVCIGERFAMMNTKIALICILSEFVVERTPATPVPLKFTKKSFTLMPESGLYMKFTEYHR